MNIKKLNLVYFSPTNGTEKILKKISTAFKNIPTEEFNLTKVENISKKKFRNNECVIFGVPVYSGRVPDVVLERLKAFSGENTLAVLVAVYGNRHYDDALLELKNFVVEQGFKPISAGAFVARHSFSTKDFPIAENRPDKNDLETAVNFGMEIFKKIQENNYDEVLVPGNFPLKPKSPRINSTPSTIEEKCTKCGKCKDVCPVDAIEINEIVKTNSDLCIKCMACVKICPVDARLILDEKLLKISKKLYLSLKEERKVEMFI